MRLEFEPNVSALPLIENELFDDVNGIELTDVAELLKKGISAAQNGERELARTLLFRATEVDSRSEDAWMWLASISEYPEELLAFLNNVLDINPKNERAGEWRVATLSLLARTLVQRGIGAHEEGANELALQCLDQALVYDEDCELAWFWKASIAESADERAQYLKRALSINPENTDARNALDSIETARSQALILEAKAAALAGKQENAIKVLDAALQGDSENAEAWILRSHLALDFDEKLHAFEKALAIEPENHAARSGYDFLTSMIASTKEQVIPDVSEPKKSVAELVPKAIVHSETLAAGTAPTDEIEFRAGDDAKSQCEENKAPESAERVSEPVSVKNDPKAGEVFGPIDYIADAARDTVESFHTLLADVQDENFAIVDGAANEESSNDVHVVEESDDNIQALPAREDLREFAVENASPEPDAVVQTAEFSCPYCSEENESQAFECSSCHAMLTLSDIETLLSNSHANRDLIQQSVTEMEAAWNLREFNEQELTGLSIGHFNLGNYERGFKYLQEASWLDPNNVILSGHLNTIAIRLEEMRRQDEVHNAMRTGKTILVVDDSPTVRKLIAGKLEKSGHHVICAVNGIDGLARIEESLPDLILLDIAMPGMDGYQVCKQIRLIPAAKNLPIVMISGKDGFFDKVRGRMAGTTGYITKPFGPETLMKALETYLVFETDPEQ